MWDRLESNQKYVWWMLAALGSLTVLVSLFHLWEVLRFVFLGVLDRDLMIYFTMGRSLLNGLSLYVEMYDCKSPGMFILTAISLLFTGGEYFLLFLQMCVLVGIPLMFLWVSLRSPTSVGMWQRAAIALAAVVFAIQLVLLLEARAGQGEIQSIGMFFACLSFLAVFAMPAKPRWHHLLLVVLPMAMTMWLFEPFAPALLAALLLTCKRKEDIFWRCLLPLALAGILALGMSLIVGGWAYIDVYLRLMLTRRMYDDHPIPLLIRGLQSRMLVLDVTYLYPASPFLGLLIYTLWGLLPLHAVESSAKRLQALLPVLLAWIAGISLLFKAYYFVLGFPPPGHLSAGVFSRWAAYHLTTWGWSICTVVLVMSLVAIYYVLRKESLSVFVRLVAAFLSLFVVSIAVGIGSYTGNHFAFAITVYLMVGLLWTRELLSGRMPKTLLVAILLSIFAIGLAYETQEQHISYLENRLGVGSAAQEDLTNRIDGILDACNYQRYFSNGHEKLVFTKHSPWGPVYFGGAQKYLPENHPLYITFYNEIISHNRLFAFSPEEMKGIQEGKGILYDFLRSVLATGYFTEEPPACAKPFLPVPGFRLFFRTDKPSTPPAA